MEIFLWAPELQISPPLKDTEIMLLDELCWNVIKQLTPDNGLKLRGGNGAHLNYKMKVILLHTFEFLPFT